MKSLVPRLRLLDRLILGAMAGPFVFGVLIFTLIFVAGDLLFEAARLIIERNVSLGVVLRLFFYRLPEVVALTFPMSSLLGALLGISNLSANSELIALRSLGISFMRVLRPVVIASLLISAFTLLFNETLVPITSIAADRLMKYEILKNQVSAVQEKVFLRDERGGELLRVLYVDQLDTEKGLMSGVMIHEFEKGRLVRTSTAQEGVWKEGEWWIEEGRVYDVTREGDVQLLFRFARQKLALNLSPAQLQRSTRRPSDMSAHELWSYVRGADMVGTDLSRLWVMFHLKVAVPWACVILALLGASFGAARQSRSGSGMSFGVSVSIVFAYYVVMSLCRALGESGSMPPILAAWTPNLLFFAVAVFFARRVD
ncbi:MAG: YjgP/YjgQ family permease [Fretibacterium sp.]|nr:YjgP/YjgQ family permease [Fretibacterium sp.]